MLRLGLGLNKNILNSRSPLDAYRDNLVMGFSYYKLLSSYKGYCVKVQRSSDDEEEYFGFKNGYIDRDAILEFCGEGNGYVSIWYNQYTGGNNAVQTTAINRPIIVSSGVFENDGIKFVKANTTRLLVADYAKSVTANPPFTLYLNTYVTTDVDQFIIARPKGETPPIAMYLYSSNDKYYPVVNSNFSPYNTTLTYPNHYNFFMSHNGSIVRCALNNEETSDISSVYSSYATPSDNVYVIGDNVAAGANTYTFNGNIKTVIQFDAIVDNKVRFLGL
jgi:hypothetical protein